MAWIESHQSLFTHRKTAKLARALGISKITAVGHLHAFWWWCLDNAPKGDLEDVDIEDIADGSGWEGDPQAFLEALIDAGFVDRDGVSLRIHDWMEYAGKLVVRRQSDAERKRNSRSKTDVPQTSDGHPKDGVRTAYVPNQPNQHNQPKTPPTPHSGEAVENGDALDETPGYSERFERFWKDEYPNHSSKLAGFKAWKRLKLDSDDKLLKSIVQNVRKRRETPDWTKEGGTFVPLLSTFLNGRRWEDPPPVPHPPPQRNGTPPEESRPMTAAEYRRHLEQRE